MKITNYLTWLVSRCDYIVSSERVVVVAVTEVVARPRLNSYNKWSFSILSRCLFYFNCTSQTEITILFESFSSDRIFNYTDGPYKFSKTDLVIYTAVHERELGLCQTWGPAHGVFWVVISILRRFSFQHSIPPRSILDL